MGCLCVQECRHNETFSTRVNNFSIFQTLLCIGRESKHIYTSSEQSTEIPVKHERLNQRKKFNGRQKEKRRCRRAKQQHQKISWKEHDYETPNQNQMNVPRSRQMDEITNIYLSPKTFGVWYWIFWGHLTMQREKVNHTQNEFCYFS